MILPQFTWRDAAARWRSVQERGFAHGWTYDHLAWRSLADEDWFATVPTLTAAALVTDSLRLGTWVASPNFRHPVTFAKELLTLDDISGGRIIAGIGAGGAGWDAEVLGTPALSPRARVDRLGEFVTLTDLLLREGDVSWRGSYFAAVRARMHPVGARQRIPFVVAANGPRSMRVAAGGDAWATTGPPGDPGTVDAWWRGVADLVARFDEIAVSAGRDPAEIDRYLDLDSAPVYSLTSVDTFTDAAGRAAALGFTDAIVHWPRPAPPYAGNERVLDAAADLLDHGSLREGP